MSEQKQAPTFDPQVADNPPDSERPSAPLGGPSHEHHHWSEERRAERWARREAHWQRRAGRHYGWLGGVVLILLGGILLLQSIGGVLQGNWWALFILVPAVGGFIAAWESYQHNGRLTRGGARSLAGGIVLTLLALAFLSNLDLSLWWPVLLIVIGLALLGTALLPA